MAKEGHPNAFVSIPKFRNADWEWIMDCHPKTLVASIYLEPTTAEKKLYDIYNEVTCEIYEMGELNTPLHLKIGLWHAELKRMGRKAPLQPSDIHRVLLPRQSFLKLLDPDNTLSVDEVRDAVIEAHRPFMKLTRRKNKEHQSMTLPELLDTTERFHLIEDKGSGWSVVRWACTCTRCFQWACCA